MRHNDGIGKKKERLQENYMDFFFFIYIYKLYIKAFHTLNIEAEKDKMYCVAQGPAEEQ